MLESFKQFIENNCSCSRNDKILLAVSGGADSVVMAHLFKKTSFDFAIAHCHFGLRGKDADEDALFVKQMAADMKVPFYLKDFDTQTYARQKNISLQMAARQLRFTWFSVLATEKNYIFVALAHNKNDSAETMLINLMRGTGIKGLHGILPINDIYIHPLLFAERSEIEKWAKENNIEYRTDKTNFEDKYLRNSLRLKVFPILKKINPSVFDSFYRTAENIYQIEQIAEEKIKEAAQSIVTYKHKHIYINKSALLKQKQNTAYLYAFINELGFNFSQVQDIIMVLTRQPGQIFYSPTHRLLNDRAYLIVDTLDNKNNKKEYLIEKDMQQLNTADFVLNFTVIPYSPDMNLKTSDANTAFFDYDKLKFPLKVRRWKKADAFCPFGMNNKKKISDFLIDNKVSMFEKEKVTVLMSGNDIVWLIGYRNDNRFRITSGTKNVLKIVTS